MQKLRIGFNSDFFEAVGSSSKLGERVESVVRADVDRTLVSRVSQLPKDR